MSRAFSMIAAFAIATMLGVGGFVGYLAGAGHLNGSRLSLIAAVLRGELDDWAVEATHSDAEHPETQPAATQPTRAHARAAEEVEARQKAESLEAMRLERARADLEARERVLNEVLAHVEAVHRQIEEKRAALEASQAKAAEEASSEGFQKELEFVAALKPALAKEHLLRVWSQSKSDAVRIMVNIDQGRGKRILEQFKTPEELQIMTELLEQIRTTGVASNAETSGTTAGATP